MSVFTPSESPYSYAYNNPISQIDLFGLYGCNPEKRNWWQKIKRWWKNQKLKRMRKGNKGKGKRNENNDTPLEDSSSESRSIASTNLLPRGINSFSFRNPRLDLKTISPPQIYIKVIPPIEPPRPQVGRIYFEGNSGTLRDLPVNQDVLNKLLKTLVDYPSLKVLIIGNTSNKRKVNGVLYGRGSKVYNQDINWGRQKSPGSIMSARAKAIMNWLINKGIEPERIMWGYGEHRFQGEQGRTTEFHFRK